MDIDGMVIQLIGVLFVFNLLIVFFGIAMPEAAPQVLPPDFSVMDYSQSAMSQDFNRMQGATSGASASSSSAGSGFTLGFAELGAAWDIISKLLSATIFGYYHIGMTIADAVEVVDENEIGAIHFLLGGIGLIFSLLIIYGFFVVVRSIIVRV